MNPVLALGLFVGIPLGLAAVIALAVMVPRRYSGADASVGEAGGLITSSAAVPNPAALPSVESGRREVTGGAHGTYVGDVADSLSSAQRQDVERIVQLARDICGYEFGVFVGEQSAGRESAEAMHAGMHDPNSAVLVAVDAKARTMDIITGSRVHRSLDDRTCEFALLTLHSSLQVGDLVGGVRDAVMLLAEHSRAPRTLHLDEPV
ncbi:MAG: DUF5130 family protein [Actinomycetota bacterium]|nr:DUF5130 family protein [Actinomycetota bacterium]